MTQATITKYENGYTVEMVTPEPWPRGSGDVCRSYVYTTLPEALLCIARAMGEKLDAVEVVTAKKGVKG